MEFNPQIYAYKVYYVDINKLNPLIQIKQIIKFEGLSFIVTETIEDFLSKKWSYTNTHVVTPGKKFDIMFMGVLKFILAYPNTKALKQTTS